MEDSVTLGGILGGVYIALRFLEAWALPKIFKNGDKNAALCKEMSELCEEIKGLKEVMQNAAVKIDYLEKTSEKTSERLEKMAFTDVRITEALLKISENLDRIERRLED